MGVEILKNRNVSGDGQTPRASTTGHTLPRGDTPTTLEESSQINELSGCVSVVGQGRKEGGGEGLAYTF